jgi:hypothetical protein
MSSSTIVRLLPKIIRVLCSSAGTVSSRTPMLAPDSHDNVSTM